MKYIGWDNILVIILSITTCTALDIYQFDWYKWLAITVLVVIVYDTFIEVMKMKWEDM